MFSNKAGPIVTPKVPPTPGGGNETIHSCFPPCGDPDFHPPIGQRPDVSSENEYLRKVLRSIRDGGHDASACRKAGEALEDIGDV
jgi:hypothetical protein